MKDESTQQKNLVTRYICEFYSEISCFFVAFYYRAVVCRVVCSVGRPCGPFAFCASCRCSGPLICRHRHVKPGREPNPQLPADFRNNETSLVHHLWTMLTHDVLQLVIKAWCAQAQNSSKSGPEPEPDNKKETNYWRRRTTKYWLLLRGTTTEELLSREGLLKNYWEGHDDESETTRRS